MNKPENRAGMARRAFLKRWAWWLPVIAFGVVVLAGAALFVVSDALIGITRFVADFGHSVPTIIAIYMLAQYLTFTGSLCTLPARKPT